MRELVESVQLVNLALYSAVAVVALWHWRRHHERAGLWAALTFGTLAAVVNAGRLVPDERDETWERIAIRALIALLVLFPYLLYRFAVSFRPPSRRLSLLVTAITVVVLAWTFALPEIPEEGEPWPLSFALYIGAFTAHWTLLTIVVTWRLWTAGGGEATVARRRMRLLAIASAAITVALLIAISAPEEGSGGTLASQLLSTLAATSFLLGLAPPPLLRMVWRRPEQARLQAAVADLIGASTHDEVIERVLPGMTEIVGARGVELHDRDGAVIGSYGSMELEDGRIARIETPAGRLVVSTSPYAPFFGAEELGLLRTLATLTSLALDRSRLFAQERGARLALERADEIKTNFIALAAHELRTPVATIHGLIETIHGRRGELSAEQVEELGRVLRSQTLRMKVLVEQLLDLSRLDANAIAIQPQPLHVRMRVEEIVSEAAGDQAAGVSVEVDPELEAEIDPSALDRIVSNLVVNALRYGAMPVTVTAVQNDRHFRLTVEDRGSGVEPEFVPDLFERFARSGGSRSRASGTGLGLAIARSYAQAHDGDLFYEPAKPHGARFQLVLPVEPRR